MAKGSVLFFSKQPLRTRGSLRLFLCSRSISDVDMRCGRNKREGQSAPMDEFIGGLIWLIHCSWGVCSILYCRGMAEGGTDAAGYALAKLSGT